MLDVCPRDCTLIRAPQRFQVQILYPVSDPVPTLKCCHTGLSLGGESAGASDASAGATGGNAGNGTVGIEDEDDESDSWDMIAFERCRERASACVCLSVTEDENEL